MKLRLSLSDREKWDDLKKTMADNDRILRLYSAYLRTCPRFVDGEMMEKMLQGGAFSSEEAYCALLEAACGLEDGAGDRRFAARYIRPSVKELNPEDYTRDEYYKNIRIADKTFGTWMLRRQRYHPYEAFIFRDSVRDKSFREIPQLGFFSREFSYPAVLEQNNEWMTVTPNEIETMSEALNEASGRVATFGLGLGYFAYMASRKPEVESVTVVERDPQVILLFEEQILPQFQEKHKIRVLCADAFRYADSLAMKDHDFVFADLWHDAGDGLEMYLRLKRIQREKPWLTWRYWIEPALLSELRRLVFDQLCRFEQTPDPKGEVIESFDRVRELLSDEYLKNLAGDLRKL